MNKVTLIGRLTKDPDISAVGANQTPCAKFTLAVDRRFKDASGNRVTDFIPCVAWKTTAQFIGNYFNKGMRIGVVGSIQTRNYDDKDGKKVYVTEIMVDEAEFVESRQEASAPAPAKGQAPVSPSAPANYTPPASFIPNKPPVQNTKLEDLAPYMELPYEL